MEKKIVKVMVYRDTLSDYRMFGVILYTIPNSRALCVEFVGVPAYIKCMGKDGFYLNSVTSMQHFYKAMETSKCELVKRLCVGENEPLPLARRIIQTYLLDR